MDYLLKNYKQHCKENFSIYGFKSYKNNHYRIINDVFQSFFLHRSTSGMSCTVEFVILPLAIDYEITKATCGAEHLKIFEGTYDWFSYDKNSEYSIDECISALVNGIKKYLIPLFKQGYCCKNAYDLIYDFEERYHPDGSNIYDDVKFYMALKNKNYDAAKDHLNTIINQTKDAYKINKVRLEDNCSLEYEKRIAMKLEKNYKLMEYILNKDDEILDNYLWENEKRNLKNLT